MGVRGNPKKGESGRWRAKQNPVTVPKLDEGKIVVGREKTFVMGQVEKQFVNLGGTPIVDMVENQRSLRGCDFMGAAIPKNVCLCFNW